MYSGVHNYCFCINNYRRQVELVTEDAVFITDIATNDDGQVTFYVYVETENGILSGIILLNAINVSSSYLWLE